MSLNSRLKQLEEEGFAKREESYLKWRQCFCSSIVLGMAIVVGFIFLLKSDHLVSENNFHSTVRERVIKCYKTANPSKVRDVKKILEKYRGDEHGLFVMLRNRYPSFRECAALVE